MILNRAVKVGVNEQRLEGLEERMMEIFGSFADCPSRHSCYRTKSCPYFWEPTKIIDFFLESKEKMNSKLKKIFK